MFTWQTVEKLLNADDIQERARLIESLQRELENEVMEPDFRCSVVAGAIKNVLRDRRDSVARRIFAESKGVQD